MIAALIPVIAGVVVDNITLPFLGAVDFGDARRPLTVLGLVAVMNVVNFSDGVDGLAAGVCVIGAIAFAIIAFDLGRDAAGILAAITAGAALGFLVHNFHPASIFMGDCGSNLLGYLLGVHRSSRARSRPTPCRARRPAGDPRRAVPRHRLRRRQADQVPRAPSTAPTPITSITA